MLPRQVEQRLHRRWVGDIAASRDRLAAALADLRGAGLRRLRILIADHHPRAGLGKPARQRRAQPAPAAGDDHHAVR